MKTIGLSPLEIRGIVERAFLPLACTCEQSADECFTVRIEDLHTGKVCLVADGVSPDRFASSRDISNLIAELRTQLESPAFGRGAALGGHMSHRARAF
ncbi:MULTISPECIES: DUF1652 domain-containing protein [Pseudomonas]|uniref:DUF1652 domain-containing protein n=1 Tax=Pseudomonas TaxID=286 RepID=UPI0015E4060D|nr:MULTISPECIES: DUF1652 domain-containing protein [Pseudomonas]MBA1245180.1 DUF1652 domain-containing protein [Pseudomonas japonica]MBA1289522.1 DUF1652 domain-containing protein [Pseudomonas japonica]